ncbi:hypothetical protein GP486_002863 [Trichoglossum hirsutum]|uniref:GS catalytic domain-containing protein n=1 Tax=Trichoglossum hirsutum TaxID=265104 RepID=A0A9P8LDK5_9PEZI|nr:hypothetical protein GP486_002863 [Trichoglossum hirsutum]
MESLSNSILKTPIIDHHAHNLLLPSKAASYPFLSITSEANGRALDYATSTLVHMRAVKQLAQVLNCEPALEAVQDRVEKERNKPASDWARRCFSGIETVLIDDGLDAGLDGATVHPYGWHDRLIQSECKRIVRIEKVAEEVLETCLGEYRTPGTQRSGSFPSAVESMFSSAIKALIADPEVAGFKSVICYRTGLAIPNIADLDFPAALESLQEGVDHQRRFTRLDDECLGPYFVHMAAQLLANSVSGAEYSKPFQFHTGLGDNDLSLHLSSPSHLEPFIKAYPTVPVVLLHASYPFTKEAGYLASVYANVFMDIGEVFPMVSQDGQERVIREALELCPTEKLLWSTDGHWFPETFLLAVVQVREAMGKILTEYVQHGALNTTQAIKVVEDIFFNTSNKLYKLGLSLPQPSQTASQPSRQGTPAGIRKIVDPTLFTQFVSDNPSTKYLRLQWLDYTTTNRVRVLLVKHALSLFQKGKSIGVTKAVLGLLQNDMISPGFSATGEYTLTPCFESLRRGERSSYATVQCEFRKKCGEQAANCPRSVLRRIVEKAAANKIEFLVGFEIEVVFMRVSTEGGELHYGKIPTSEGHAWSSSRALQNDDVMSIIEAIVDALEISGIQLQQFHAESSPGQYEFITGPLPPLLAVDTLLATREIISAIAATHSPHKAFRATFTPRPFPNAAGTGAHAHISIIPDTNYEMFYAGVLKHLRAITAFTYSRDSSYERVRDGIWAGGRWVAWGTQNRETPLRKIEDSHWEIKCIDGLANTYLALGAILGAGLQGILDRTELMMGDCLADPSTLTSRERARLGIRENMPASLAEALECLWGDDELREILGQEAVRTYVAVKGAEVELLEKMKPEAVRRWLIERY